MSLFFFGYQLKTWGVCQGHYIPVFQRLFPEHCSYYEISQLISNPAAAFSGVPWSLGLYMQSLAVVRLLKGRLNADFGSRPCSQALCSPSCFRLMGLQGLLQPDKTAGFCGAHFPALWIPNVFRENFGVNVDLILLSFPFFREYSSSNLAYIACFPVALNSSFRYFV